MDAKDNVGPGTQRQGEKSTPNLGHLKKFFGLELLRKDLHFQQMFGRGMTFHTKKVGISDHNVTCHYCLKSWI